MSVSGFHRVKTKAELKQNSLTLRGSGGIIQEKPITMITEQAIARVPKSDVPGLSDEQNALLQELHKNLLRTARDKNGSNETAFVLSSDLKKLSEHFGSDKSIEFSAGTIPQDRKIAILHNHPRGGSFSLNDLYVFLMEDNIEMMSVVKNNGGTEVIRKSKTYNITEITNIYHRAIKKYGRSAKAAEKIISKFVERGYVLCAE